MSMSYRTPNRLIKTVALTTVPEKISVTSIPASTVILIGCKAAQTDNATTIYIGTTSADGSQVIPIPPGGQYILNGVDLSEWYVDVGTNNDGIIALYW